MANGKIKVTAGAALGAALATLGIASVGASPALAGGGCANAGASLDTLSRGDASKAFICLFNQQRKNSVSKNGDLAKAAQNHSDTMREENCLAHECSGKPGLKRRVKNTGYLKGAEAFQIGETIAFGVDKSPSDIIKKWLSSSDHRELIKRNSFDDVGVGVNNGGNGAFITAVFGVRD